jgi:F420-non-reducing hydrogenase iron-sulfur subunit
MTVKRMRYLQELLAVFGLEGRLHLEWISSAEAQKFVQVVTDFTEKIKGLGPSPLSVFIKNAKNYTPKPAKDHAAVYDIKERGLFDKPPYNLNGLQGV